MKTTLISGIKEQWRFLRNAMVNPWIKVDHRPSLHSTVILTILHLVSSVFQIFKMYLY